MEIQNAIIESATITSENQGCLSAWLYLKYEHSSQGFGGYALYFPKNFSHHNIQSVAGHFIWRVMEVTGVTTWDDLPGKTVRVEASINHVKRIGHIVKDDWFDPEQDFSEIKKEVQK